MSAYNTYILAMCPVSRAAIGNALAPLMGYKGTLSAFGSNPVCKFSKNGIDYWYFATIVNDDRAPIVSAIMSGDFSYFTSRGVQSATAQVVHDEFVLETCAAADFHTYKDTFLASYTQVGA